MAVQILIVDDEPDVELIFQQKYRRRIRRGELQFHFALNGQAALDLLRQEPEIHLVFTDLNMPVMGGLALLREIRELQREALVSLVISAYGDMDNIRAAMNQGAFDFITKPIDLTDLDQVLDKALGEVGKILNQQETEAKLVVSEQKREESEYLRQIQKEFFDNITHEIRTPLTLLLGPLGQALDLAGNDAHRRLLLQAQRNGQLLLDLVNQLLDFARVDARALKIYPQPLDLRETTEQLTETFRTLADQKQIDLRTEWPEHLPLLHADPRLISRVLLNLLSNALKFTPNGGRVAVILSETNEGIQLEVQDSGPGISPADQEKVFDRFFRSEQGSAYQGTGIGLALTKTIVKLHGGEIGVESIPGQGARFRVVLPLQPPGEHVAAVVEREKEGEETEPKSGNEEPILVVLAEDNVEMRAYVEGILEEKYQVLAAPDGRAALELVDEHLPDLVVSDVMMPGMNGFQLCGQIKSQCTTNHIPVILLTAKSHADDRVEGLQVGADAYLAKPFHAPELHAQIGNLLQQRSQLRERYKEEFLLHPAPSKELSMDEQFLARIRSLIETNIENEQFGVEWLADEMAMSRRNLTRKVKALTGTPPAKLIRTYRLEKALDLMKSRSATMREIALRTGFGSSSYFTNCFKSHYGQSPREYLETHFA